jgi:hypothetical protein
MVTLMDGEIMLASGNVGETGSFTYTTSTLTRAMWATTILRHRDRRCFHRL